MPQMHTRLHRNTSIQQYIVQPGTSNALQQSLLSCDLKAPSKGR